MPAVSTYSGVSLAQNVPTYVEGVWTPTFTGATVVGSPTYAGRYTRIGRIVYFSISITPSVGNTLASTFGTTYCDNLPFTAANTALWEVANETTKAVMGRGPVIRGTAFFYLPTMTASTTDTWVAAGTVEVA